MSRQKLIDILSNFTVTDDYLGELVDTSLLGGLENGWLILNG